MPANRCPNPNCEYFNRTLPNNAKVCPMCGTALGNVVAPAPAPSEQALTPEPPVVRVPVPSPTSQPPPPPVAQEPIANVSPATPPAYTPPPPPARPALRLIHSSGREFTLPGVGGDIGRRVQSSKTVPEIDLSGIPDEGIVSRSHARIYWDWSQSTYMIVDNNSRNGTYLNGNSLSPGVQYSLKHSDSLQLGQNNLVFFTVVLT